MMAKKIVIIKLGALGDVVRTLSILPAIKKKHPDSEIYWITKENALQLFENNPYITKVFKIPYKVDKKEKFDILYNFDVEEAATKLAKEINADKKLGFYSEDGFPAAFNLPAEYYLNTIFDDLLKKENKKTYQEMMFSAAELDWKREHCPIYLNKKDKKYGEEFIEKNKINSDKLIGIHLGAGARWPSKAWHPENLKSFIKKAKEKGFEILLFGGPEEIQKIQELKKDLEKQNIKVFINDPKNSIKEFTSLVNYCKKMVCSDSFALHIAIALKKPTIGLFFCTSPNEVEDYKLLKKLVSPLLYDFFPSKMNKFDENLVKSILPEEVINLL